MACWSGCVKFTNSSFVQSNCAGAYKQMALGLITVFSASHINYIFPWSQNRETVNHCFVFLRHYNCTMHFVTGKSLSAISCQLGQASANTILDLCQGLALKVIPTIILGWICNCF